MYRLANFRGAGSRNEGNNLNNNNTENVVTNVVDRIGEQTDKEKSLQEQKNELALGIIENTEFLRPLLYVQDVELYNERPETEGYIQGRYEGIGINRHFIRGEGTDFPNFLENSTVTDIGFDGNNLYVVDNDLGHYRVNDPEKDPRILEGLPPIRVSASDVDTLARNVANQMSQLYNTSHPIFDAELGYLRTNFVSSSVAPYGNTMALRISRPSLAIKNLDDMGTPEVAQLLGAFMRSRLNLLISGSTGSGKTEMQKASISYIPPHHKISLMEDTLDSHIKEIYAEKDINSWRTVRSTGKDSVADDIDFNALLRAALRNFPDWAMVSEVRGEEAGALLSVALSGHSVMTTLHTQGADSIPERLADMVSMGNSKMDYGALLRNILSVFKIGMHLERGKDPDTGKTIRYIREIYEFVDYDKDTGVIGHPIYRRYQKYNATTGKYEVKKQHYRISDELLAKLEDNREYGSVPTVFRQGDYPYKTMASKKSATASEEG